MNLLNVTVKLRVGCNFHTVRVVVVQRGKERETNLIESCMAPDEIYTLSDFA